MQLTPANVVDARYGGYQESGVTGPHGVDVTAMLRYSHGYTLATKLFVLLII